MSEDRAYFYSGGTVLIRTPTEQSPWLMTWLPDSQDDPAYPGFTLSPTEVEFPTLNGVGGILEWVAKQPWARRAAGEDVEVPAAPANSDPLPIPADEYAALTKQVKMEFGYRIAFAPEPDGSFSWVVAADDGTELQSGTADNWDDARLEVIARLSPPSNEALDGD